METKDQPKVEPRWLRLVRRQLITVKLRTKAST